jgi:hypothetical protein
MRNAGVKAARPAVFFLCTALLALAACQDVFRSSAVLAFIPRYTVTFDAAGGDPGKQTRTVPHDSQIAPRLSQPKPGILSAAGTPDRMAAANRSPLLLR